VNGNYNPNHPSGHPNHPGGQPQYGTGQQPMGTIYIGFDQPVNVAPHPQPHPAQPHPAQPHPAQPHPAQPHPAQPHPAAQFAQPQHMGYQTRQATVNNSNAENGVYFNEKKKRNTLGLLGFIVGVCGLATAAAPVALAGGAVSTLGLFRQRRFLALTGLVIALVNPATQKFATKFSHPDRHTQRAAHRLMQEQISKVNQTLEQAEKSILSFYNDNGKTWPDDVQGNMLTVDMKDPWGHPVRYDEMNDRLLVRSYGPDGEPENSDDITLAIEHFRKGETPVTTDF